MASVNEIRKALEKKYKSASELFVDLTARKEIDVIPFRSIVLNTITGVGGVPRGRLTEIFGTESSGKTTLATELCADLQSANSDAVIVYIDYEHVFNAVYAANLGLDISHPNFVFSQPETFEQGWDILDTFLNEDSVDLIVIDSGTAMIPKDSMESDVGDKFKVAGRARMMSEMMKRTTKKLSRGRQPAMVLINQMRNRINTNPYMSGPESTASEAEKFYASLRIRLEIQKKEGDKKESGAMTQMYQQNRVRAVTVKNKVAPPFMKGLFIIEYGKGINNVVSIGEMAIKGLGLAKGAVVKWDGKTPATQISVKGFDSFYEELETNRDLYLEVQEAVVQYMEKVISADLKVSHIRSGGAAKEIEYDPTDDEDTSGLPTTSPTF